MPSPLDSLELRDTPQGCELAVKVVPGASRTRIAGVWGKALKLAVAAPPEGGKANAAVVALLAETFGVRRHTVHIIAGHTKPLKRFVIEGLTAALGRARLRG